MRFIYPRKTETLIKYDPDYICDKIIGNSVKLLQEYGFGKFDSQKLLQESFDIKSSSIYSRLLLKMDDGKDSKYIIQFLIPDIKDGFVFSKGIKRYVQQQLRDSLFVPAVQKQTRYMKIVPDFNISIIFSENRNIKVDYSSINIWDFLIELGDANDISEVTQNLPNEFKDEFLEAVLSKKKGKLITKTNRIAFEWLKILINYSDIFKDKYSKSVSKFVIDLINNFSNNIIDRGLNLQTRRVRNINELVYSALMTQFVTLLLKSRFSNSNKLYQEIIEPFYGLYDFTVVETMFNSPFSSLSDKVRLTLTGFGGFGDNVPTSIRNLHQSHYGNIDCVSTPDRERCGVVLFLAYDAKLDSFGRFLNIEKIFEETIQEVQGEE